VRVELTSRSGLTAGEQFRSGLGSLRVRELVWTSSEIELVGCASALGSLARWLIPLAHAHGQSSPTLLAVPSVVRASASETVPMGGLAPPAGRYCTVRYRVAPADGDALGLSAVPEMLDHSFLLRGEFGSSAGDLQEFELLSQRAFDVSREIDLELSSEHPLAGVELRLDPERWLAGLDLGSVSAGAREEALMAMFGAALDVQVE
jgi:hypothetical protein